ncbi:hypothetical protein QVD17_38514 [Tagetes erecta]|uniref:DUF7026 domain-containing protein n=1 Tax=Tagetes erecta TaxID=13708 RepID=A0AAD8N9E6_TARER|nr:hypothetical protein QVD17_38514 [Tagetes erecta]
MALISFHLLHLQHLPKTPPFHPKLQTHPKHLQISCSNSSSNNISDMDLALGLEKMKTQMLQTQEAMKTSRKLVYTELCLYLGLGKEELKKKWEKMRDDDKCVLAQEFVSDWGFNFHPLSPKSVQQLVDQHLLDDDNDDDKDVDDGFYLFSGLKKLMGFQDDK